MPPPEPAVRDGPLRVALLSELPTPYRWPLFQRVAEREDLDVTVFFYSRSEADRDWGLDVPEGPGRPEVVFLAGRAVPVRGRRSLFFHVNPEIRARLSAGRFDVVVVPGWSMPTTLMAITWCWAHRTPYVVFSETHARSPRPFLLRALKKVLLRPFVGWASAWLATGELSRQFLVAHGARDAGVFRFANTPDVEALAARVDAARAGRAATRAALGVSGDAVVALFVGRLIGAKDPLTLVRAQAAAERRGSSGWLVVVGDGPEAKSARDEAAALNLAHIVFTGSRRPEELPALFAAADLFVLPSLHEPWGVVVNEAMASGLALITSDRVGAAEDLLAPGRNGATFPAGDAAALAEALVRYYDDPALTTAHGRASREIVAGWGYGPSVEGFAAAVRHAAEARR